jgi:hypothetical protein
MYIFRPLIYNKRAQHRLIDVGSIPFSIDQNFDGKPFPMDPKLVQKFSTMEMENIQTSLYLSSYELRNFFD